MLRRFGCFVGVLFVCLAVVPSLAQTGASAATTTCNFDPDKQLAVEYQHLQFPPKVKVLGSDVPYGQVWAPGGKPMKLFTNTTVSIGGSQLPIGAYTMFVIPEQKKWTLIISKSADTSGKYDQTQDLARVDMQYGKLPQAVPEFTAYFAHVAAGQCNLRLDLNKARAWVVFNLK
ncbi:MAG TPA: DUF2911 domain-containing protein [Candidatus Bathyarchaeia archaeon]|nr:DUF2911 domain-containing protein [Candidatus Bathyarchaeia archaeon]